VAKTFGITVCRETIRKVIQRLGFSWKKGKKLLARADPAQRQSFVERIRALLLSAAKDDEQLLVYIDEAHIHQDADLGYGWTERGERAWVSSTSPGLSAKVSFYGLYLYNEIAFSRRRRGARGASGPETGAKTLVERTRPGGQGQVIGDFTQTGGLRGRREGGGDGAIVAAALGRGPSDDAWKGSTWGSEARSWARGRTCPWGRWRRPPRQGERGEGSW